MKYARVLQKNLGQDFWIHEEGLNGRTTCMDDPYWPGRNGSKDLDRILETHEPLDLTILMLGTNDLKNFFFPNAERLAINICNLATRIRDWTKSPVLVVCPTPLGPDMETGPCRLDFPGESQQVSKDLSPVLEKMCQDLGFDFLDAGKYAQTDPRDSIHLTPESHRALGQAIYKKISEMDI